MNITYKLKTILNFVSIFLLQDHNSELKVKEQLGLDLNFSLLLLNLRLQYAKIPSLEAPF